MFETALILLVDDDGALLMQHRDARTPLGANKWGLPGGHVEAGETPTAAAHRELLEETGLTVATLWPFWDGPRPADPAVSDSITMHAFYSRTDAKQHDVVLGEGLAMTFVPAREVLELDLTVSAGFLVPMFLSSEQYALLH